MRNIVFMKINLNALILLLSVFLLNSCTNENIDTLSDNSSNVNLNNVTYTNSISGIISNNCISCHGSVNPNAGLDLSTYTLVKNNVDLILGRIDLQTGQTGIMPPSGRMPDNNIQAFKNWKTQGLNE